MVPYTGRLKEKLVFSQFWRLAIHGQDSRQWDVWLGSTSWLSYGCFLAECSHDLFFVHPWREGPGQGFSSVSFYKDTKPVGSGPHPYELI